MTLAEPGGLAHADLWLAIGAYATALLAVAGVAAWLRRALVREVDAEAKRVLAEAISREVETQTGGLRLAVLGSDGTRSLRETTAVLQAEVAAARGDAESLRRDLDGISHRLDTLRAEYMRFLEGHFGSGA